MPRSSKLKSAGEKPHYTFCDCPFCGKQAIRKDHYPGHLKTELKKLEITEADKLVEHLNEQEGPRDFNYISGCNIVFRESDTSGGFKKYHLGICLDCHRPVPNKDEHTTAAFTEHDCEYRKRKPDVIEHVKVEAPVKEKESNIVRNLRNVILHNVERHASLSADDKAALKVYFKDCRSSDKSSEGLADEIDSMVSQILRYLCRVIKDLKECGNTDELDDKFLQAFPDLLNKESSVIDQVKKYLRAWRKYRSEAEDTQGTIKKAVDAANAEVEQELTAMTIKNTAWMHENVKLQDALTSSQSRETQLEKEVRRLQGLLIEAQKPKEATGVINGFKPQ